MEVDFGRAGGGVVQFDNIEQLASHVDSEMALWVNDPAVQAHRTNETPGFQMGDELVDILGNWRKIKQRAWQLSQQGQSNGHWIGEQVSNSIRADPVLAHGSGDGRVTLEMLASSSLAEAGAAARFFAGSDETKIVDGMNKAQLTGILDGWARTRHFDTKSATAARASIRRTIDELERRVQEHAIEAVSNADAVASQIKASDARLDQQRQEFQLFVEQSRQRIISDRQRWQAEWTGSYETYVEQLKLRAAVHQWGERADAHELSFVSRRNWTVGAGAVGLAGAIVWSTMSLWLAKWLFVGAFVEGTMKAKEGFLRPTWSHELIFGAAATVLYLTLFLWTMRILVRMMMSEHHLGVDARGRESMAHTYLALLEDKGATSTEDRAIVLAALFRPITDGLVKDDALPMISPAAFLSGGLAGK